MTNADKRTVHTDALETLGTIIGDNEKRDAIHIAVLPVQASERLLPGQDIAVTDGKASRHGKHVGIVDPFLKEPIREGERFWLLLYPRMVTSLRHVWSHPAFADETTAPAPVAGAADSAEEPDPNPYKLVKALAWVDQFCAEHDVTRDLMIQGAKDYIDRGEYLCEGGRWEGVFVDEDSPFWEHFEAITGQAVPQNERGNFFSCSC